MNVPNWGDNYIDATNEIIGGASDSIIINGSTTTSNYLYITNNSNLNLYNPNTYGEIRFANLLTNGNTTRNHNVKIDYFGKLQVYHTYNLSTPTVLEGWKDVEAEIAGLIFGVQASVLDIIAVQGQIAGINAEITFLQGKVTGLEPFVTAINANMEALHYGFYSQSLYEEMVQNNFSVLINQIPSLVSSFRDVAFNTRVSQFIGGLVIPAAAGSVIGFFANHLDNHNLYVTYSNALNSNQNLTPAQRNQLLQPSSNIIRNNYISFNSNFCNMTLEQGFINSNIITTQYVPSLKSNKILLGNITTPNSSYQMEMTGDLNTNMLYINSTSLTSLLNQKQNNLTAVSPLYITTGNIGINYDSTLLLTSGVLGVGISAESKWLFTGGNIYNKSLTNVGIGTLSVQSKLHLHQSTVNTECQIRFTNAQSGNNATTDGVYMGLDGNSPYTFLIDSKTATGQIRFRTADNTRMTLTSSGKVGIGVATPQQLLSVGGSLESTNGNSDKILMSYDAINSYRHRIATNHDSTATDNNFIQFYNWRYGQTASTLGDKSVATFHNKYSRFDGNRYFWINDIVNDVGTRDYTLTPLSIFNQTASSTSVLNDPQPVLNLARQGTTAQSTAQNACFKLCRFENNSNNSRTQLNIDLSHNANDDVNIMALRSDGNIGIGTTIPLYKLHVQNGSLFVGNINDTNAGSLIANGNRIVFDNSYTNYGENKCNKILLYNNSYLNGSLAGIGIQQYGVAYSVWTNGYHAFYDNLETVNNGRLRLLIGNISYFYSQVGIGTNTVSYDLHVAGTAKTDSLNTGAISCTSLNLNSGNITNAGSITSTTFTGALAGNSTTATSTNTWIPLTNYWFNDIDGNPRFYFKKDTTGTPADHYSLYRSGSYRHIFTDKDNTQYCELERFGFSHVHPVTTSTTDFLAVLEPNSQNSYQYRTALIKFGSFTEFHRVFVDDDLYIDYDDFISKYVGCVVVSTGRTKHAKKEAGDTPWEVLEDKDAITIDDAQPIVQLSRQKKDKRVYGVVTYRQTTDYGGRICANALGEGGLWIVNTNGNLQNGDYLQTSDEIGYAERQDDDIMRNYTIAKIIMDCDFQLDSAKYKCEVIDTERDLRRAFVGVVYYCG